MADSVESLDADGREGWFPPVLASLRRHVRTTDFQIWIGPGWWPLALACHEELVRVDPEYEINAVKQKYGALEFQMVIRSERDPIAEALDEITARYRDASETICEICGHDAELVTRGVLELTRCQSCWDAALEADREEMGRSVRFIGMRLYLYDGVERCADAEYHARHWRSNGEFRGRPPDFGNLDFVIHAILDDNSLADFPISESVGVLLIGKNEAVAAAELLREFVAALKEADPGRIIESPEWARTVEAADRLRVLMEANDPTLKRQPWPYVPVVAPKRTSSVAARLSALLRRGR